MMDVVVSMSVHQSETMHSSFRKPYTEIKREVLSPSCIFFFLQIPGDFFKGFKVTLNVAHLLHSRNPKQHLLP